MQTWTNGHIVVQAWQNIPDKLETLGLTLDDVMTQVWFVDGNGRLTGGAAAINASLASIWWFKPIALLYKLPGLRQLEDRVYRWVADNRYRLPGSTPQCAIPKEKTE
ncbi:MAG: DUF393 domain-containing protein [Anaerolineales bacterium]|nr:DUF393 domain-containing protein [Anaerolineales bacterium]